MKTITFVTAVAFVLTVAGSGQAWAGAHTATANAGASASVTNPIAIVKVKDLNFGEVRASGVAGTAVVSPAGVRTVTGGVTEGSSAGLSNAEFTVTGDPSSTYTITLPVSATLTGPASSTIVVDTFTSDPSSPGALSALTGTQTLKVGATLNVAVPQATGTYTGTFAVTVAYN